MARNIYCYEIFMFMVTCLSLFSLFIGYLDYYNLDSCPETYKKCEINNKEICINNFIKLPCNSHKYDVIFCNNEEICLKEYHVGDFVPNQYIRNVGEYELKFSMFMMGLLFISIICKMNELEKEMERIEENLVPLIERV